MKEIKTEAFFLVKNGSAEQAFEKREHTITVIQDNEIVIEAEAFGLNFADVMARKGLYRDAPPIPCVLGYEVVGKVVAVGSEKLNDMVGKRVAAFTRFGAYAKHVVTRVDAAVIVGEEPAAELLSLCTQGVTAYYMAEYLINIHKGENVLIHAAAGGVGTILIQLVKKNGGTVLAKVGSDDKVLLAKELGADYTINYNTVDYEVEAQKIIGQKSLDVSFNPAGGSTYKKDMALLGAGGRIVLFGGSELERGGGGIFGKLNFLRKMGILIPVFLMVKSRNILGVNMLRIADEKPEILRNCLEAIVGLYNDGLIRPQVGGEYSADQLAKAHTALESGKTSGKLAIFW